jgi:hypothetical protein
LFVELLVVLDSTVFDIFQHDFPGFGDTRIKEYIKLFFCHVINGVSTINNLSYLIINFLLVFLKINQRFKNSLQNDLDLMITASLSDVLIFEVSLSFRRFKLD